MFFVVGLPGDILDWIELFNRSLLSGLLAFEWQLVLSVILSVPLLLYVALHRFNPLLTSLYLALSLLGAPVFVVSRPGFELLWLQRTN